MTEIKNAVEATDFEAQYDSCAKRLLGNRHIVSHILVHTVDEFKGMDPEKVVDLIEGGIHISKVPVEPGLTNKALFTDKRGERITGLNTEQLEINEGKAQFDILFYVRRKDRLSQVIINIEAQRKRQTGAVKYNRAVFYVSRMISSEKERDFKGDDYAGMKDCYSIWVYMNMPSDVLSTFRLAEECTLGYYDWSANRYLMNIVMIGLSGDIKETDGEHRLHRLLAAVLSDKLRKEEKYRILEEYGIPLETEMETEVEEMCSLGRGIREEAWEEAWGEAWEKSKKEEWKKIVFRMRSLEWPDDQIALALGLSLEEVGAIASEKGTDVA